MTTTRASKLSRAGVCAGLACAVACGAAGPVTVEAPAASPSAEASARRRPDAVVLEPPPALPIPASHAEARGVVALREPVAGDALREIVLQVTSAWQLGSLEALVALLTNDAGPIEARVRGRGPLVEGWRQRLRAHEYVRLAGVELVRAERIERWSWDELGASNAPARPADMRPDEVYLRAPLEVTHLINNSEKFFEDELVLLVRLEDGHYRVSAYGETSAR